MNCFKITYKTIYGCLGILLMLAATSCRKGLSETGIENNRSATVTTGASGLTLTMPKTKARDMVLIYGAGTESDQQWDPYAFHPYVVYKNKQNLYDWMFDGFLFLELKDQWDYSFTAGHGDPNKPALKANWNTMLDKYFTAGRSLHALDQAIDDATWSAGQPPNKRKIIIGIPEPLKSAGTNWGMAQGIWLDFQNDAHRTMACKWFIDEVIARFNAANFRHLVLDGFYWIGEEVGNASTVTLDVANYLAPKNYCFTWIPWWQSPGYNNPTAFGFSDTYLQPNYFFYPTVPYSRLQDACNAAYANHTYLEMEFDENVLYTASYRTKMNEYMDVFGSNNVYGNMKLAYYQSKNTILQLYTQKDYHPPLDSIYRKFCEIVTARQKVVNPPYMN
ncbi:DUF4855 domain-containing protein [Chitinophaga qingshengii]|uniref:DUF4855 domain-containing protein n=1 Tax=Chitinophaga qingshengii TaxID=1569794 RepID=A0ABR7TYN0_9BACT|nr:DUF4855 domain-containing protein [Chitinophaga qingshengii]MBC9934930.1 DUF4855 domain-containing protein [Chitinophaga qingshengii]